MNQRNFQKELEKVLDGIKKQEKVPTLFLHSCCAPCSSYVLEYLAPYFQITVFYYNPNISASAEYQHRVEEQKRLIACYNQEGKGHEIQIVEGDWKPADFYEAVKGLEHIPEGGERCFRCYELRLRETALQAAKRGMDYFGTTLTISPLKNAAKLNETGEKLMEEMQSATQWLPSDFKKKGGYQRSVELSGVYDLYRQDFCGCSFSKAEAELRRQKAEGQKSRNLSADIAVCGKIW